MTRLIPLAALALVLTACLFKKTSEDTDIPEVAPSTPTSEELTFEAVFGRLCVEECIPADTATERSYYLAWASETHEVCGTACLRATCVGGYHLGDCEYGHPAGCGFTYPGASSSAENFDTCMGRCTEYRDKSGSNPDYLVCDADNPPRNQDEIDAWAQAMLTRDCDNPDQPLCLID